MQKHEGGCQPHHHVINSLHSLKTHKESLHANKSVVKTKKTVIKPIMLATIVWKENEQCSGGHRIGQWGQRV